MAAYNADRVIALTFNLFPGTHRPPGCVSPDENRAPLQLVPTNASTLGTRHTHHWSGFVINPIEQA